MCVEGEGLLACRCVVHHAPIVGDSDTCGNDGWGHSPIGGSNRDGTDGPWWVQLMVLIGMVGVAIGWVIIFVRLFS